MKVCIVSFLTFVCLFMGTPIMTLVQAEAVKVAPNLAPKILFCSMRLPEDLTKKYSEKTISLKILVSISVEGKVDSDVRLIDSSGDTALDDAVMESVKTFRFIPARQDYKTIPSKVKLPVKIVKGEYTPEDGEMINES